MLRTSDRPSDCRAVRVRAERSCYNSGRYSFLPVRRQRGLPICRGLLSCCLFLPWDRFHHLAASFPLPSLFKSRGPGSTSASTSRTVLAGSPPGSCKRGVRTCPSARNTLRVIPLGFIASLTTTPTAVTARERNIRPGGRRASHSAATIPHLPLPRPVPGPRPRGPVPSNRGMLSSLHPVPFSISPLRSGELSRSEGIQDIPHRSRSVCVYLDSRRGQGCKRLRAHISGNHCLDA